MHYLYEAAGSQPAAYLCRHLGAYCKETRRFLLSLRPGSPLHSPQTTDRSMPRDGEDYRNMDQQQFDRRRAGRSAAGRAAGPDPRRRRGPQEPGARHQRRSRGAEHHDRRHRQRTRHSTYTIGAHGRKLTMVVCCAANGQRHPGHFKRRAGGARGQRAQEEGNLVLYTAVLKVNVG